jgi:DNA-binding beta-propeller fold protein YncE
VAEEELRRAGRGTAQDPDLGADLPAGRSPGQQGVRVLNTNTGTVTRIDHMDLSTVDTYGVGNDPTDIEVGLGAVWVANRGDGTLSKTDPVLGTVETIRVGGPVAALAADEETCTLWLQPVDKPVA